MNGHEEKPTSSDNPESKAEFPAPHPGWEIFQQITRSDGDRMFWKTEALRVSYFVFSQNFAALRSLIANFENPANRAEFVGIDKRDRVKSIQMENMRHLHNFLAGAVTLIAHSRVFVNKLYRNHSFLGEYRNKVQEVFGNSGPAGLVSGLRNWMVHRDIVPVKFVFGLFTNRTQSVMLDIKELKSYDNWDPRAKAFLVGCDSDLQLLPIVQAYHDQVEQLYAWLGERMGQVHATAFGELAELKAQYRRAHFGA
jgi:hypothetical protein